MGRDASNSMYFMAEKREFVISPENLPLLMHQEDWQVR